MTEHTHADTFTSGPLTIEGVRRAVHEVDRIDRRYLLRAVRTLREAGVAVRVSRLDSGVVRVVVRGGGVDATAWARTVREALRMAIAFGQEPPSRMTSRAALVLWAKFDPPLQFHWDSVLE